MRLGLSKREERGNIPSSENEVLPLKVKKLCFFDREDLSTDIIIELILDKTSQITFFRSYKRRTVTISSIEIRTKDLEKDKDFSV